MEPFDAVNGVFFPIICWLLASAVLYAGRRGKSEPEAGDLFRLFSFFLLVVYGTMIPVASSGPGLMLFFVICLAGVVFSFKAEGRLMPWLLFSILLCAGITGLRLTFNAPADQIKITEVLARQGIVYILVVISVVCYFSFRTTWRRIDFGLTFKGADARRLAVAALSGTLGWLAANALYYFMLRLGLDDTAGLVIQALIDADTLPELAGMAILIVFLAPVVEEFIFRGVIFGVIQKRYNVVYAVTASAIPFTILHGSPVQYPGIMLIAVILAFLYHRTGSLAVSIAAHSAFNCVSFVLFLVAGPDFLHP